jgi:hypothetical protein
MQRKFLEMFKLLQFLVVLILSSNTFADRSITNKPIDGAFGLKFGQVMPSEGMSNHDKFHSFFFRPRNTIEGVDEYYYNKSPVSNEIWRIVASWKDRDCSEKFDLLEEYILKKYGERYDNSLDHPKWRDTEKNVIILNCHLSGGGSIVYLSNRFADKTEDEILKMKLNKLEKVDL